MKTILQFIDCRPTVEVRRHVEEKIQKLEERFNIIIDGKVCLRRSKNDKKKNKITEIRYTIPQNTIYAEGIAESYLESCDKAFFAIQQQLEKHKTVLSLKHKFSLNNSK